MIKQIIELLQTNEFKDSHEVIQIAKGKYKFPETIKEIRKYLKNK